MAIEQVPLWVTVVTGMLTALFGAGGGAAIVKSWLTYKTRGLELEHEGEKANAGLYDEIYQRLEASFNSQLQSCYDTIAKHEQRLQQLEADKEALQNNQWQLVGELDMQRERGRRMHMHQVKAQEALNNKDTVRASFALEAAMDENREIMRHTDQLRSLASEGSNVEDDLKAAP